MSALRILMIGSGTEIHALRPLNWLLERGCQVTLCDAVNPYPDRRDGYDHRPFPQPVGVRWLSRIGAHRLANRYAAVAVAPKLRKLWREVRPHVTHVHWVDIRAYHCARAGTKPLLLSVWGSDINRLFTPEMGRSSRHQIGYALRASNRVLVDSNDLPDKCAQIAGQPIRTELMTPGVDTSQFRPGYQAEAAEWRRQLDVAPGTTLFLSIRGWSPLYRHTAILEAFAAALPRFPSPAVLVFKILHRSTADPVAYEKQMRELADQLGVARHVRWMNEVPMSRLPEIYAMADALVNYPSMDAFPVTFLEAAACERPVISARLPAYHDTFATRFFHMVSPENGLELSDALVDFVSSRHRAPPEQLAELRRLICEQFDERQSADRLIRIYRDLAAG